MMIRSFEGGAPREEPRDAGDEDEDLEDETEDLDDDVDHGWNEPLLAFDLQEPHEPHISIEALEEGYGGDSDGHDYDGYTAQERELRDVGGVVGMSMEIGDAEMPEAEHEVLGGWELDDRDLF